ncbi:MAG: Uma2 family endonuclease [Anaerolineae bacterium]|nr:Uma2 family endonuclease [Anaerolineae bacterium]
MGVQTQHMTVEEFEAFAAQVENAERRLEFIGGQTAERIPHSYRSIVAALIAAKIGNFVNQYNLGYVTGADGGYAVGDDRYIPDVGFISKAKQPEAPHDTFIPQPPDLAVEVISPTDRPHETRIKVINYVAAGTVVWLVDPEQKTVEVYTPGPRVITARLDDTLDGGAVLPGFSLAVREIFPE